MTSEHIGLENSSGSRDFLPTQLPKEIPDVISSTYPSGVGGGFGASLHQKSEEKVDVRVQLTSLARQLRSFYYLLCSWGM